MNNSCAMLSFVAFFSMAQIRLSAEGGHFEKKLPDGTQWEVFSTTMTEKRPITYNTGRRGKDGQFVTDMELSTYIVKRFSLSKTVGGECETVWEREEIFPVNLGMPTSGMTPHYGTIVWDVAESNNVVLSSAPSMGVSE